MAKSSSPKILIFIVVALIGGAAGFGYFKQASKLSPEEKAPVAELQSEDAALLAPKPNDIILGDINAVVTIVEYSSLSCPHCAHFHDDVLPTLEKEFITPGKVKLVVRPFPTNEPAMKAAQLVECAGKEGKSRTDFMKVLFSMQSQWAMDENFLKNLKQIALVGGMDSASFDSCVADKEGETAILTNRQAAGEKLAITATPTFFINGIKYEGEYSVEGFREAIANTAGGK